MRKLTVAAFMSLDTVMQAPGGVLISRYERSGEVKTGSFM